MDTKRAVRIPVYGFGSGGAGATIIECEVAATDGVIWAYVNSSTETARVDYDSAKPDPWVLRWAVQQAASDAPRPMDA